MQKKKENISQCPPSVQKIINTANSLPPGFKAVDDLVLPKGIENQKTYFYEKVATLPNEFIENNGWLQGILNGDYDKVNAPLLMLSNEIYKAKKARHGLAFVVRTNNRKQTYLKTDLLRFSALNVNDDGVIELFTSYPIDILINEKIHTRRIQHCRNCKNFFWVKRLNKNVENETCQKCSNVLSQRQFQTKHKKEIKKQRRIAYYRKKGIKILCEKCGRPQIKCGGC